MRVLIVDDEPNIRLLIGDILGDAGYTTVEAADGLEAQAILRREHFDIAVVDVKMPGMGGLDLLTWICHTDIPVSVLILTAYGSVEMAVAALKSGAHDYITKPFQEEELLHAIGAIAEVRQLKDEVQRLRTQRAGLWGIGAIEGTSAAIAVLKDMILKVAPLDITVLVTGESGVGKELVAAALHAHGVRSAGPFVTLNCGAIPETLLESELFGHEKGAFTGAVYTRQGRFELARGGTLFLDEVGEMSAQMQVKLLRVLQDGTFQRVGGTSTLTSDARVVAATNRDLEEEVARGRFREDLYYRLNVIQLRVPPLRERASDIPLLSAAFAASSFDRFGRIPVPFTPEATQAMLAYQWPGNVRELRHAVEMAVALSAPGQSLGVACLPERIAGGGSNTPIGPDPGGATITSATSPASTASATSAATVTGPDSPDTLEIRLRGIERAIIVDTLEAHGWNQTRAAQELGLARESLIYRMKKHGIRRQL